MSTLLYCLDLSLALIPYNVIHMSDLYFTGEDDGASNREEVPQLDP